LRTNPTPSALDVGDYCALDRWHFRIAGTFGLSPPGWG
jgi:hypothetical protein